MQLVIPMHPRQEKNWDGKRNMELSVCVQIPGDGRVRIPTDIENKLSNKEGTHKIHFVLWVPSLL